MLEPVPRCAAVFDDVPCLKYAGHDGAHVGCNGEAWSTFTLARRPAWRRALGVPGLYRAHRRLGLPRLAAWRLACSILRGGCA